MYIDLNRTKSKRSTSFSGNTSAPSNDFRDSIIKSNIVVASLDVRETGDSLKKFIENDEYD